MFFADTGMASSISCAGLRYGGKRKVVELLNARPCCTSSRSSTTELLRSIAMAQREHRARITKAQKHLEIRRSAVVDLQKEWEVTCAQVALQRRNRLRRFAVLLTEKIKKEHSLRAELAAQMNGPLSAITHHATEHFERVQECRFCQHRQCPQCAWRAWWSRSPRQREDWRGLCSRPGKR